MGWAKFDDQFTRHPKVIAAGPWAELLAMRGVIYAAGLETDGFIPTAGLAHIGAGIPAVRKRAAALVEVGLWEESDGGWVIHDFLDYHPSKAERDVDRGYARRRWALNNNPGLRQAIRDRDGDNCRYCGVEVNWSDRKGRAGGTYDHVVPVTRGGTDDLENIVVCCRGCNNRKGDRLLEVSGLVLCQMPSEFNLDNSEQPQPVPRTPNTTTAENGFTAFNAKRAAEAVKQRKRQGLPVKSEGGLARTIQADANHIAESQRLWAHRNCENCSGQGAIKAYAPGAGMVETPCTAGGV